MSKIKIEIKVKCFKDKPTGAWVMYSEKYDIYSYGRTKKKAKEMFDSTIKEILLHTKPKKK
jgi:hypothetical protein